jgi:hypothetical protein
VQLAASAGLGCKSMQEGMCVHCTLWAAVHKQTSELQLVIPGKHYFDGVF